MYRCPLCETPVEEGAFIDKFVSDFNKVEYKLYQCLNKDCDLHWWEPLKIIPEFYEGEFMEDYKLFHMGYRENIDRNHEMFFEHIPIKSGRLLDVGCGDGRFLKEAEKRGYEVWGIDFDEKSIKVCQEKRGLKNTFAIAPEEFAQFCEKENIKFDIVTFFEVLEHQDNPMGFLKSVKRMLKEGGYVAGSVPNRESLTMKMVRASHPQMDYPPHHFLRFSKKALSYALAEAGFKHVFISTTKESLSDISASLQTLITGDKINHLLREKITGSRYAVEGTSLYKNISLVRKSLFKALKAARSILLFIPSVAVKFGSEGRNLYFQGKLPSSDP